VTHHPFIAILFWMAFSAFVATLLADSLGIKVPRAKDDK
jgi:hypothetical protein